VSRRAAAHDAAGYLLVETVALGLVVLAMGATLGLFARAALLEAEGRAHMDAALIARAQFSLLMARTDAGEAIASDTLTVQRNDIDYTVTAACDANDIFYDVTIRVVWTSVGRAHTAVFVRRLRAHGA